MANCYERARGESGRGAQNHVFLGRLAARLPPQSPQGLTTVCTRGFLGKLIRVVRLSISCLPVSKPDCQREHRNRNASNERNGLRPSRRSRPPEGNPPISPSQPIPTERLAPAGGVCPGSPCGHDHPSRWTGNPGSPDMTGRPQCGEIPHFFHFLKSVHVLGPPST